MARAPHLLLAISAHGYGHLAQAAPVVERLRARYPGLRVTVAADMPADILAPRLAGPFAHERIQCDVGMIMTSAFRVDRAASAAAYTEFHATWDERVAHMADALRRMAPDLVLADVPYLPLAAAARAGIPALGLSSLNWADIYAHCCGDAPQAPKIHAQILAAYNSATGFLRLEPGMPMPDLQRVSVIGPVARLGRERRAAVRQRLGIAPTTRLVLVSLGGIPTQASLAQWPRRPDVFYLAPAAWVQDHPRAAAIESLDLPFPDVLRSVDVILCKPGYGTFSEAACNGVPVLYITRDDWPEEACLVEWLTQHAPALEVSRTLLASGELQDALARLDALPPRTPVAPTGMEEAVNHLVRLL
jgi:hypothetical protein